MYLCKVYLLYTFGTNIIDNTGTPAGAVVHVTINDLLLHKISSCIAAP